MADTSLVPVNSYAVVRNGAEFLTEIISENMGDSKISVGALDSTNVPAGGATSWEVPSLTGTEGVKELVGIVIHHTNPRVLYMEKYTGDDKKPDCSSFDGVWGFGDPGGECAKCHFAQWGSDLFGGQGSACKPRKTLYLLRQDDLLPLVIKLPTTSVRIVKDFLLRLTSKGIPHFGVIVGLSLDKVPANPPVPAYSRVNIRVVDILNEEQREAMYSVKHTLAPLLSQVAISDGEEIIGDDERL